MDGKQTDPEQQAKLSESTQKVVDDLQAASDFVIEEAAETYEKAATNESAPRTKLYAILAGIGLLVFFVLTTAGLYALGDDSQSSLERLRDIAVIYIVLISVILVIILGATTAALVYLIMQIKGEVIPLLEELNATMTRLRGTTEFMSEQAVKPVINVSSKVAQWKAMARVATGKEPK